MNESMDITDSNNTEICELPQINDTTIKKEILDDQVDENVKVDITDDSEIKHDIHEISTNSSDTPKTCNAIVKAEITENQSKEEMEIDSKVEPGNVLKKCMKKDSVVKGIIQENKNRKVDLTAKPKFSLEFKKFQLPLRQGWKREIVERGKQDAKTRKRCDIYYYPPSYKKLRSIVEIDRYLQEHPCDLTVQNFTFSQNPIFEPPAEIIRKAKPLIECVQEAPKKSSTKKHSEPKIKIKKSPEKNVIEVPVKKSPEKNVIEVPVKREKRQITPSLKMKEHIENTKLLSENDLSNKTSKHINLKVNQIFNRTNKSKHLPHNHTLQIPYKSKSVNLKSNQILNTSKFNPTKVNKIQNVCESNNLKTYQTLNRVDTSNNTEFSGNWNNSFDNKQVQLNSMISASNSTKFSSISTSRISETQSIIKEDTEIDSGIVNHLCSTKCKTTKEKYPSLECCVCRCLFHPECTEYVKGSIFICKMCKGSFVIINCTYKAAPSS